MSDGWISVKDLAKLEKLTEQIRRIPPHNHQQLGFVANCDGCKARQELPAPPKEEA